MDYIRKLPLLMALAVGIIVGLVGYSNRVPNNENMLRMTILMLVFYIVGYLIRSTVMDIVESYKKKKLEEEREKRRLEDQKRKEELFAKDKDKGQVLDLKTDDNLGLDDIEDGFDALPVADFIKSELDQK